MDVSEMYRARMAGNILRRRLRETLREELGTTYSVGVNFGNPSRVTNYGTITVAYSSAPEKADLMADTTLAIIKALRADGPKAEEVTSLKEQERRELEVAEKQNAWWLGSLQLVHQLGLIAEVQEPHVDAAEAAHAERPQRVDHALVHRPIEADLRAVAEQPEEQ